MEIKQNIILAGHQGKPVPLDLYYQADGKAKPVVIFAHGFKGFKDWGHWHLVAQEFAKAGFIFIKFNFSHNGTTLKHKSEFVDLEAFGQNNFSKEMDDLQRVIDWLDEQDIVPSREMHPDKLYLIGHSRGGAIAILKAQQDKRVTGLISWASVHGLDYAWQDEAALEEWKKNGVYYIFNSRTFQEMPLYYQLYEDFKVNKEDLDVERAARELTKPFLILHGSADPAVPLAAARQLQAWCPSATLEVIEGADHVFGGKHPYAPEQLPPDSLSLCQKSIEFLRVNGK